MRTYQDNWYNWALRRAMGSLFSSKNNPDDLDVQFEDIVPPVMVMPKSAMSQRYALQLLLLGVSKAARERLKYALRVTFCIAPPSHCVLWQQPGLIWDVQFLVDIAPIE